MTLRFLALPLALAGCPAPADTDTSPGTSTGETSTGDAATADVPTSSTQQPTTSDPSTDPATTDAPTTGDPTTGDPTTGGPTSAGARVLYFVGSEMLGDHGALRLVDDRLPDGPAAPVTVLDPPAGGTLGDLTIAPSGTRGVLTGIGGDLVPHLYVLDMATLAVTEVTLPAALEWVGSPEFSPDEQTLAFAGSSLANTADLYLCPFMPEGSCTPAQWTAPPMMGGTALTGAFAFSDDGLRIAFTADPGGTGGDQLFLGEVDAPGVTVELASFPEPYTDVGLLRFSADGDALYYSADELANATYEYHAIDVSSDPPGPPVPLSPPVIFDVFGRMASDRSALHWWTGDALRGDLSWIPVTGTTAGPAILLNSDGPGRVKPKWATSEDAKRILYLSDHQQQPDSDDLYMVDVGGPNPTAPIRVNAPLGPGGAVGNSVEFISDGQRAVYFAYEGDAGYELFLADLAVPESGVKLSAPLPDGGTIQTVAWFSPDESKVAFMGNQTSAEVMDLLLVDLSGPQPSAPAIVTPALPTGEVSGFWGVKYAPDGLRMYVSTPHVDGLTLLYRLGDTGQGPVMLSLPGENVAGDFVLPP